MSEEKVEFDDLNIEGIGGFAAGNLIVQPDYVHESGGAYIDIYEDSNSAIIFIKPEDVRRLRRELKKILKAGPQ